MHCFTCNNKNADSYYPMILPDRFKIRCYRCDYSSTERKVSGIKNILQLEDNWKPPPLPPTKKEAERIYHEQKRIEEKELAYQKKKIWDEEHELNNFNVLVKPPINYGGNGESSLSLQPRILSSCISIPGALAELTSFEVRKKKYKKKRTKAIKKLAEKKN